jgi:hypothetical protein
MNFTLAAVWHCQSTRSRDGCRTRREALESQPVQARPARISYGPRPTVYPRTYSGPDRLHGGHQIAPMGAERKR